MGEGEADSPSETPKSSLAQEQPPPSSPATVYPDWASLQAYYNAAGRNISPFFPPAVSSPQVYPYMWGHQIIPSYGTTPAYVAMYPPGGFYPHPPVPAGSHPHSPYILPLNNGTAEVPVPTSGGTEVECKSHEYKEKRPLKRSGESLRSLTMPASEVNDEKPSGTSANVIVPQSDESGSEGSSEETEEHSPNMLTCGSQQKQGDERGSEDDEVRNESPNRVKFNKVMVHPPPETVLKHSTPLMGVPQGATCPTISLNIGMDYWGGHTTASVSTLREKLPAVPSTGVISSNVTVSHDGISSELWMQDEKELKRERRKQSNRESARRSRLRKQAECEDLARLCATLKDENDYLGKEMHHMLKECENLAAENALLTKRLMGDWKKEAEGEGGSVEGDDQLDCNSSLAPGN